MDIRQIIEEKRDFFKAMDLAIDKTLNVQDAQMRKEGRLELDKLRGKDPGVPFFIGYAYEFEYDCSKDTKYAWRKRSIPTHLERHNPPTIIAKMGLKRA